VAEDVTVRRHHPDWLKAFADLFDGRVEAPRRLLTWTGVATIAGALTRRVWIDETIFRYYPNFFIIFVAPPGLLTKSTTISLGINLLKELDHIYLAADNTTFPAFIESLAKRTSDIRETVEADSADDLWIRQCAVTAAISEFGTFFKPEDEDMVNGLTDLWDCRPIMVKETKTSGNDVVEHPFVNLIAGTTPSWIQSKIKSQIGGWGLSSRILFIYAGEKTRYIARPSKLWSPGEFDRATVSLVEDLRQIADLNGEFQFMESADALAQSWYEGLSRHIVEHHLTPDSDTWLGHFLARKQAHVHKLAMVLSASRRSNLIITEEDLTEAIAHVDAVEQEVPGIFKLTPEPSYLAGLEREVLDRLTVALQSAPQSTLPRATLFSRVSRFVDSSTANRIVDNAVARGAFKQLIKIGGVAHIQLPGGGDDC
jgi:Protein of unknown function (DUF3987)